MTPDELDDVRVALEGHKPRKCHKCSGYGWLWHHELDHVERPNRSDPTRYSCDACGDGYHDCFPGGTVAALIAHIDTLDGLLGRFEHDHDAYRDGLARGRLEGRKELWMALAEESEKQQLQAEESRAVHGIESPRWIADEAIARAFTFLIVRLARRFPWDGQPDPEEKEP